jgi:hypothetical protein
MSFDVYCAICGVCFSGIRIDWRAGPEELRRRRFLVALTRGREPYDPAKDGAEFGYLWEEGGWTSIRGHHNTYDSYDPDLVTQESVEWLAESRCLGIGMDTQESGPER